MEADSELVKEFLGDNAYKVRFMNEEEKRETLLQAKTRDYSNHFGKHRHAYERQPSPPGFWRMDFPTTQESREDREKAKTFERELVQQRYMEAMRSNGAYKFKDE
jgi:hypothetical protein